MLNYHNKTKEELLKELQEIRQEYNSLKLSYEKDITERRLAEKALQEGEERFRSLYENSTMGIYRTTPEGQILLANDTLIKMLGFSSFDDLLSIELDKDDYEPNYDRKKFIEKIEKEGEIIGLEAQWTKKDGTPIYIRESARAIYDSNHKTLYYDGIIEDVSELKKSELERHIIYEITQGNTTTDNLNALLKLIHQSLAKMIYADNIFVALYDQNTELFSFPYWVDKFDPIPEPVAMQKSLSSYVFRAGKSILFSEELFQQLKDQNEVTLVGSPSPSWIGVPLKTPARTIGVLVLQHYEKENVYSVHDVHFLDSVGSQIALAIERKQSEEELHESEIKLNVILQSTADGILAVDSNGKVIKTNKRFTELWRIPQTLVDSGDDNTLIAFVLDQLSNPDEFISKVQKLYHSTDEDLDHLYFKDGRTFERFSSPMVMNDSSIGRVWSFRDITEQRLAEEKIKESEKKFRTVVEEAAEIIFTVDNNGYFTYSNPRGTKLSGYSLDELTKLRFIDLIEPEFKRMVTRKYYRQYLNKEALSKTEYPFRTKSGEIKWFNQNARLIIENDVVKGFYVIARDVTEIHKAEKLIQLSEEKYRTLVETMSDGVYRSTHNGKFIEVNPAMVRILGYDSKDELLAIDIKSELYFAEKDRESAALEEKFEEMAVFRLRKKDGSEIWVEDHGRHVLDDKGEILYHEGSLRDITDRKYAEDEIIQKNATLLKINAEKDKFFSIIAHDLKSPFNSIIGFSDLLVEQVRNKEYEGIEKYAGIVQQSSKRAMDLLMNLMEWSQSQTGRMEYNPEHFEMVNLIKETTLLLSGALEQKSLSLSKNVPSNAPVFADKKMISTVLRNLISNAIKYTHIEGRIIISVKEKQNELLVSVSDTGVGISKDNCEKLFKIDETYSSPGTNKEKGTGLGLILCKEFVEKHGGKIWVESEEGIGSTFIFTLPIKA